MATTALLTHPDCLRHPIPEGHPERPERVTVISEELVRQGLYDFLRLEDAPAATVAQLRRVHTADHVSHVLLPPASGVQRIDDDTALYPGTGRAAVHAAGAVVRATDLVMSGTVTRAFCNVRPPGHHATRDQAMGFCYLNNVAVGAAHALDGHGAQRVAILDFDAHQCNGTMDVFADDARVLLCSTFQHPLYPDTGLRAPRAGVIQGPLPPGSDGEVFRRVVAGGWWPALAQMRPEVIFVSAGFDGHVHDDISDLALTDDDYRWVTDLIVDAAERWADGRIVSVLEGGYCLSGLARAAACHVRALMGLS